MAVLHHADAYEVWEVDGLDDAYTLKLANPESKADHKYTLEAGYEYTVSAGNRSALGWGATRKRARQMACLRFLAEAHPQHPNPRPQPQPASPLNRALTPTLTLALARRTRSSGCGVRSRHCTTRRGATARTPPSSTRRRTPCRCCPGRRPRRSRYVARTG